MLQSTQPGSSRPAQLIGVAMLALTLAACGGGGGSPGATGSNPGTGTGSGTGTGTTPAEPTLTLAMVDGSGAAVTTLSGAQSAILRATVKDAAGKTVALAVVNYSAADASLITLEPQSALSDASGVAVVNVKPASSQAAGATTITASAVVGGKTVSASVNMAVGAAPLTLGELSLVPAPTGPLPAFSTVQVNIPVTSGGQPATSVSGLVLSSLCAGDGTATLVPGSLGNGVQTATYTNNGCLRGNDTITASIGNSSKTVSLAVSPADIGAINFVSSSSGSNAIVLRGSGGLGRSESAQVTFRVVDQHNNPLPGVDVNFRPTTTTGGLSVTPAKATTDGAGNVTTVVSSGTIPTPVRVIAEASRGGTIISGLSDALTISTGLPIQKNMSMSASVFNIEGLSYDGETTSITVRMADQYGNPVSDGAVVNFVTEGGAIGSSAQGACQTVDGACSVTLVSQQFKPTNGRVTVLSYVQGLENFTDTNGDGQFSCAEVRDASGNVPAVYRPLVDTCVSGPEPFADQGDPFLDTGNHAVVWGVQSGDTLDGIYQSDSDHEDKPFPYGHASYNVKGDGHWGLNYIWRSFEIVFSGSRPTLMRQVCNTSGCRDWTAADGDVSVIKGLDGASCAAQTLTYRIYDVNNNPMPAGTTVGTASADKVSPGATFPATVPSTNQIGGTIHSVLIKPDTNCVPGSFVVSIATPKGEGTAFSFRSGQ